MNLRTTVILFGLLCAGLGVWAAFQIFGVETPEEAKEKARWVIPSLNDKLKPVPPAQITRVVLDRAASSSQKAERMEFVRKGDDWQLVSPLQTRADQSNVNRLISQVMNAEREKYHEFKSNLAEYGLENPPISVTLYRGDEAYVLNVGDAGPGKDPPVYVTSSERTKQPSAVIKSRLDRVYAPLGDYRSKDLFTSSFDIQSIRVTGAGRKSIELEKVDNKDWRFKEPKVGEADGKAADDLALAIGQIRVEKNEDFVADGKLDNAALEKYGLADGKEAYRVVMQRKPLDPAKSKEPVTESLLIGAKDPQPETRAAQQRAAGLVGQALSPTAAIGFFHAREKQSQEGGSYFAKMAGENNIVRIDANHLKKIDKKPDELRSKAVVKIDGTKVDAIDLTTGGETLRLRRPTLKSPADGTLSAPSEWDLYSATRAKVKAHANVVTNLIDAVNKVELKDTKAFLDDDAKLRDWFGMETIDLGLDKPRAEMVVWLEAIQRDKDGKVEGDGEPKLKDAVKAKPLVKLALGRKDDKRGVVYVRRQFGDDPAAVLAVPDPFISLTPPEQPQFPGQPPRPRDAVSLSDKLTGGYLAFRDHQLPSFNLNHATKLTYQRGGETYQLEKETKKDDKGAEVGTWLLKKPVEGKAGFTVDFLISLFSRMSAEKLLTDRASERDLKEKFGLSEKPLLQATVTTQEKDKKASEFTYTIGKLAEGDVPHKDHYYARVDVKPGEGPAPEANQFVFLVSKDALRTLDQELRDSQVFPGELSARPQELTLTWRKLDKDKKFQETKLDLVLQPEKEGSDKKEWVVKTLTVDGKDAKMTLPKIDAAKLESFLGIAMQATFGGPKMNPLHTERFVIHNGKPEPKHRLDPAGKDAPPNLIVEVKYDNKSTRTLMIGERWERKDNAPGLRQPVYYYAHASSLPNAVFLLSELEFKELVGGVDFFKPSVAAATP